MYINIAVNSSRRTTNTRQIESKIYRTAFLFVSAHNSFCSSFLFFLFFSFCSLPVPVHDVIRCQSNRKKNQTRSRRSPIFCVCGAVALWSMPKHWHWWCHWPAPLNRFAIVIICPNIAQNLIKLRTFFILCAWRMATKEVEKDLKQRRNIYIYYHFDPSCGLVSECVMCLMCLANGIYFPFFAFLLFRPCLHLFEAE